jgi:hypothetical protein
MSPNAGVRGVCGAGSQALSQREQLCTSRDIGAQKNFGDLTPYLTYAPHLFFSREFVPLVTRLQSLSHPSAEHRHRNFHILSLNENLMLLFLRRPHGSVGEGSAGGGRRGKCGGEGGEGEGGLQSLSLSLCPH